VVESAEETLYPLVLSQIPNENPPRYEMHALQDFGMLQTGSPSQSSSPINVIPSIAHNINTAEKVAPAWNYQSFTVEYRSIDFLLWNRTEHLLNLDMPGYWGVKRAGPGGYDPPVYRLMGSETDGAGLGYEKWNLTMQAFDSCIAYSSNEGWERTVTLDNDTIV
jgi:hypothetical protein